MKPTDIVMNQITPVDQESPVTFGHVKLQIYIDIYNTRISYPTLVILIALADINACFCFAKIHADLAGAFGFLADDLYNLTTAIIFGSTASASSWESFWRAIKALTKVFANRPDLVIKHKKYLDMLKWEMINQNGKKVRAFLCATNWGIIDKEGKPINLPACIYVDDTLMLATSIEHMEMVLATMIVAIFTVMGKPNNSVRQCPLAMDKWNKLVIGPRQIGLGLIIDTNWLTVTIPIKYLT